METSDRISYPVFSWGPRFRCGYPSNFIEIEPLRRYLFVSSSKPQRIQRESANEPNTLYSLQLFSSL